ncbi:MAG TPA: cytochrome c [Anaeromyxobacteraceae bacterium]|nr:cytochrome c [Anaeromyxobacteraceae bacterium]
MEPGMEAARQLPVQLLIVLLATGYLAWLGVVTASFTAAVAMDGLGSSAIRRFAGPVARLGRLSLVSAALLEAGAIVLLVLARVRYPAFVQTGGFWAGVLLPLAAGLALLGLFEAQLTQERHPSLRLAAGLTGVGLSVASTWVLVSGAGALLQPEAWPMAEPPWRFLPTWSGTGRFGEWTLLSFAATGVLIAWAGERAGDPAVTRFARRFGGGVTFVGALGWAPAILFSHYNLPDVTLSPALWALAVAGVLLSGLTAGLAASRLGGGAAPRVRPLAVAASALLGILVVSDHVSRERALVPATLAGVFPAPSAPARAAPAAPEAAGKLAAGKAVFDRVCSLCHRFDVRLVGPPFDETVPKYRKDPGALKAFIRDPVKKDPGYPPMPKPAVTEAEIDAVVTYLLEKAAR